MTEELFKEQDNAREEKKPESYIGELVGDGKKYKDVETLGKSHFEADLHIQRLEKENRELRDETLRREAIEDMLERQKNMFTRASGVEDEDNASNQQTPVDENQNRSNSIDIDNLLEQKLKEREKAQTAALNVNKVREGVTEVFGNDAKKAWDAAKKEANLTEEQMQRWAQEAPSAVLKLVKASYEPQTKNAPVNLQGKTIDPTKVAFNNSVNTSGRKTDAEWRALKKSQNYTLTPQQSKQRMDDARALGDAFWT